MLTKRDLKQLEAYRRYHDAPPSYGSLLTRLLFRSPYLLSQALLRLVAYFYYSFDERVGFLMLGISLGIFIRDAANLVRFARAWPLFDSLLDWAKIEELVKYGSLPESDGSHSSGVRG